VGQLAGEKAAIEDRLTRELSEATERHERAKQKFEIASCHARNIGLDQPDGAFANASSQQGIQDEH
jgi:hypothetical protein